MRKLFILLSLMILLTGAAFSAVQKNGALNIVTQLTNVRIYVDGEFRSTTTIQLNPIQAGKHFVKVTKADDGITIFAEIVDVTENEMATIYITEKGAPIPDAPKRTGGTDVFMAKKILDYSKEMHSGWFLKMGYISNHYFNLDDTNKTFDSSNFCPGIGFKLALAQNIDITIELERTGMSARNTSWTYTPFTANLQFSFLPNPYFKGKQYYGIGLGYLMTDLETEFKENLTALGWHLFYGLEMPTSDMNAFFFEVGYTLADMARYNYNFNSASINFGYRWDVPQ
jgi:hypothetical protein